MTIDLTEIDAAIQQLRESVSKFVASEQKLRGEE
jgi:hypothetical protein